MVLTKSQTPFWVFYLHLLVDQGNCEPCFSGPCISTSGRRVEAIRRGGWRVEGSDVRKGNLIEEEGGMCGRECWGKGGS